VNGSMQISDAIRRGIDTLTATSKDATAQALSQIELTIKHIKELQDGKAEHTAHVETLVELLERSRQQIEKSSVAAQSHVTTMNNVVETQGEKLQLSAVSLSEHVKSVTRALEEPLRLVGIAIADADGSHEQIQSTLER